MDANVIDMVAVKDVLVTNTSIEFKQATEPMFANQIALVLDILLRSCLVSKEVLQ
jgi:hypothetical protein